MSLKKKIALGFLISAFIIAILATFEYINFIEIKKEIRNLELADTIRSKSLQLRRHEKNFFLYGMPKAAEESEAIHKYLRELNTVLDGNDKAGKLAHLKNRINEYGARFNKIELSVKDMTDEFQRAKGSYARYNKFFPLIELTFMESPDQAAEFLEKVFLLPQQHRLIIGLKELYSDMQILRKEGEDIINISKELDKTARENVEGVIHMSQIAILIFFPLFLIVGIGMLFVISNNVVNRLKLLIDLVEKTGKGDYSHIPVSSHKDEVGVLIREFNDMENQLSEREEELERKNKELLQSRKLAALGTLASGVAHELNNPLNNIYISAQVLMKEAGDSCSLTARETVNDILGQTLRVKGIVGDLLEFARGREPQMREVELNEIIMGAYKLTSAIVNTEMINFVIRKDFEEIKIFADHEQMERVFINLFNNAVDAMNGKGDLIVKIERNKDAIKIKISDTGKGMPPDAVEKIFEPFYTTKDKGTGLGLAIVFNIIKKHGGEINAQSEEGRGTTFTITLPLMKESREF
ncbi:MAG: GHKL domain-containing protein [Nitrospirae bacterium]|nr:GHKL domain-containing protein [Nitrospirota bacterium]